MWQSTSPLHEICLSLLVWIRNCLRQSPHYCCFVLVVASICLQNISFSQEKQICCQFCDNVFPKMWRLVVAVVFIRQQLCLKVKIMLNDNMFFWSSGNRNIKKILQLRNCNSCFYSSLLDYYVLLIGLLLFSWSNRVLINYSINIFYLKYISYKFLFLCVCVWGGDLLMLATM